ncbi:MAG: sigma-70 family RNA polymerase sigma factor [Phycisphaerae bacterium]|nr:sigma-70 family RNA polymerase sigma factor [Phycisphaerae bacterium]
MDSTAVNSKLIADAASGDVAALEALINLHYSSLLAYAERHMPAELRRHTGPRDVIQDVVFEAIRRIRELKNLEPRALESWLFTIARNRIGQELRMHRAQKRGAGRTRGENELDNGESEVIQLLQDLAVYERTPSQSALARERIEQLEEAMANLNGDQQIVLRMRYMQGMDVSEVASALHRSEGAIRNVCMRGLKSLRELLLSSSHAGQ